MTQCFGRKMWRNWVKTAYKPGWAGFEPTLVQNFFWPPGVVPLDLGEFFGIFCVFRFLPQQKNNEKSNFKSFGKIK
jgi:hypothetical protein